MESTPIRRGVAAGLLALTLSAHAAAYAAPAPVPAVTTGAAATSVTAGPSASIAEVGRRVLVNGTVTAPSPRKVHLQKLVGQTWRTVESASTSGRFSLTLPTDDAGINTYRVTVPATSTHRARNSRAFTVGVGRGAIASTGYLASPPVRWDPCTVVGYRVNVSGAPAGALADVKAAMAAASAATGVSFRYLGTTDLVPGTRSSSAPDPYPAGTDIVIAYTTPGRSALLDESRDAIGVGGVFYTRATQSAGGKSWHQAVQGYVVLDSTASLPGGFGSGRTTGTPGTWGQVLMHEIGHVVGLDHPGNGDQEQIMYPATTRKPAEWGAGDLAGLYRLGAASGCFAAPGAGAAPGDPESPTRVTPAAPDRLAYAGDSTQNDSPTAARSGGRKASDPGAGATRDRTLLLHAHG